MLQADLLVVNKIDLAPHVGADLERMRGDVHVHPARPAVAVHGSPAARRRRGGGIHRSSPRRAVRSSPRTVNAVVAEPAQGVLELTLAQDGRGRAAVHDRRQRFPLRTTVPFYLDSAAPDMAFIYVQNPTGGLFAGDDLRVAVSLGARTRAHLTTQSATKLLRMDDDGMGRQELEITLDAGAYLESIPDALIPQADTCYHQLTRVSLEPDAACVLVETVAPGRRAFGERFAYRLLELVTEVRCGGRELCADALRMEPGRAPVNRAGVMGDADYLVSMMALAPGRDSAALALHVDQELIALRSLGVRGAAGELPNDAGVIVRALAPDAPSAGSAVRCAWAVARERLVGLPLPEARK